MIRLAFLIHEDWREVSSGVATYIRIVYDEWQTRYDCRMIDYHVTRASNLCENIDAGSGTIVKDHFLRLGAGYVKMLFHDVVYVFSVRSKTKKRIIVTNHFGCETMPIALRILNPFSLIIAIAHTYPGQDSKANDFLRRFVEELCYKCVSDVIFNSNSVKSQWAMKLNKASIKGTVIHHGISAPDLTLPDDYPMKSERNVDFVCVSRFAQGKGHIQLLKAWARTMLRVENDQTQYKVRLILVGDGQYFQNCHTVVKELKIEDSVFFLGDRRDGDRYFNGADVAVQLSTGPEAFGLVVLEALSRGVPVVASRLGGIVEIVEDGKQGVLVDPFNLDEVSSALCDLLGRGHLKTAFRQSCLERWEDEFSLQQMNVKYDQYFRTISGA